MSDADVRWVATLSNGATAVENSGEYKLIAGQRKPWVRLCTFLAENDLHLTSLRLNFKGRTIHMPRANFDRFGFNECSRSPLFYALEYHAEVDMSNGEARSEEHFVDLQAHYEGFTVHYIQDLQEGNNSWVTVTQGYNPMASTPRRRDG